MIYNVLNSTRQLVSYLLFCERIIFVLILARLESLLWNLEETVAIFDVIFIATVAPQKGKSKSYSFLCINEEN